MKLDIGGGKLPAAGYRNVDPLHGDAVLGLNVRVQDGLPLGDCSVAAARASHVLEHIPSGSERVKALNEVWRVLVPGGEFEIIVPTIGHTSAEGPPVFSGWQAWADPTHVSYWWYPESFLYLVRGGFAAHADYGLHLWDLGDHELKDGWEAHVTLVKPMEAS